MLDPFGGSLWTICSNFWPLPLHKYVIYIIVWNGEGTQASLPQGIISKAVILISSAYNIYWGYYNDNALFAVRPNYEIVEGCQISSLDLIFQLHSYMFASLNTCSIPVPLRGHLFVLYLKLPFVLGKNYDVRYTVLSLNEKIIWYDLNNSNRQ